MKELARQQMHIQMSTMDMLNQQVAMEAQASAAYLAMASWCEQQGYTNSAAFFYAQSEEERMHMLKIFKFINDSGGNAVSPQVGTSNHEFASLESLYEIALGQEIAVSQQIHKMVSHCRKENDINGEHFLRWFVMEQMEEETKMRDILQLFDLMGRDPIALKFIDERIKVGE